MDSNNRTTSIIQLTSNKPLWFFFTISFIVLDYTRFYQELRVGFLRPLMIVIMILAYFLFVSGEHRFAKSKQTTLIWFFVLLLFCYIPFAKNGNFAYIVAKSQLLYMPFILSVIITVNSMERLKRFLLILICIELYISVYAFINVGYGPGNYFGDENDLSLYVNMWLPFCYFLFFVYKRKVEKLICLCGLTIGLLSIIVSFSRGGFVGLLAMGGMVWLFSKKKMISIFMILILVGMMLLFADQKYWSEMSTTTNTEEGTARGRIESWKAAWSMFLDYPLGVGGNNFSIRFQEYQTDYFQRGMYGRVSHSLWFTLIPELGVIGIWIYFSLLYYNLKDVILLIKIPIKQNQDDENKIFLNHVGRAFIASFAGFFISGTFISVLYYAHYWYMVGLLVATMKIFENYNTQGYLEQR